MIYIIVKWDSEKLIYEIIHYSHNFWDMERMSQLYSEENGYEHLISLKALKSHEIMQKVKEFRDRKGVK